jgi:hypothetical protein
MTIMAGIYSRSPTEPPPSELCRQLRTQLSRRRGDKITEFADGRVWMAKVDIGVFGSPGAYRGADGSCSLLTGEPLLDDDAGERHSNLRKLHGDWSNEDWRSTARTRGSFCAAHYLPAKQRLCLVTDRLGLRGLYFMMTDRFLVFATAFRIIEALAGIEKSLDVAAVAEECTFGMPLGDRTIFLEAKRLLAAEAVVVEPDHVKRFCYWSWDSIAPSPENGVVERLYERFMEAISLGRKNDTAALSLLSGGLDSRVIAAGLARQGATVHTLCLGNQQSQDGVLSRRFAEALGTHHVECDIDRPSEGAWWERVAKGMAVLREAAAAAPHPPERPGLLWSGEGGSVCFGHVHLTQAIVDLVRRQSWAEFFEEFAAYNYWSSAWTRILRRGWSRDLGARVERGFRDEMGRAAPADPGRVPYFFLLFNDQRRKLDAFQANADLIRAELLTPFFDIDFVREIAASQIDRFIGHKLYVEWLRQFQPEVYSVPWQSYPGHVPSPIGPPEGLEYQWGRRAKLTAEARRFYRAVLGKALRASVMPGWLIRREVVAAATALAMLGIAKYGYLAGYADAFAAAYTKCRAGRR